MSWPADCSACQLGWHDRHTTSPGPRRPNLIGGVVCTCTGDCAERHAASAARLNATLFAPARRGD